MERIVFASDHAGFALREALAGHAGALGYETWSVGAQDESGYDYPDAADLAAKDLVSGNADRAVLVCGSGIGISIRANRHAGVRAANCCSVEMAELARRHNHANALCLGSRLVEETLAKEILETFLKTDEDRDVRHQRRVELLDGSACEAAGERC